MRPHFTLLSSLSVAALVVGSTFATNTSTSAQTVLQPTTFSLDVPVATLIAERPIQTLPVWIESLSVQPQIKESGNPKHKIVRLRLRKLSGLIQAIELRVTLNAALGPQGFISGWSESGQESFHSKPFGSHEATVTEVVQIPTLNVDYIDIAIPGDGTRLGGMFATAMKSSAVLHPIDFPPPSVLDGFSASPKNQPEEDKDLLLMGRVAALLDAGPFTIEEASPTSLEFELSKIPSVALLTFEVRNILGGDPPLARINGVELPPGCLHLPDLADPAWRIKKGLGLPESAIQYTGWIRIQQLLPKSVLLQGVNEFSLQQPRFGGAAEVRNVQLQIRNLR